MDLVVSAIVGNIVDRFISFLFKKYESQKNLEKNMERLQHLLLKVHMIVEEAEGRCITNSKMLLQLKKIVEAMYQGYHVLDIIKHRTLHSSIQYKEVSSSNTLSTTTCYPNPFRAAIRHNQLQGTLESLETIVSSMTDFVFLLSGCERMSRKPYDTYLYFDNFMFGREVEKQQLINTLLQENIPPFAPTVLPIIGPSRVGSRVGKRTLVAHVCNNEIVRSHFSSILHLNGENIMTMECATFTERRDLVVVEFTRNIDDQNWKKFYASCTHMGRGSKIIIISRIERISRFGTVRPIHLKSLSLEEYSYLFKVLAFGNINPEEHPQLLCIANELSVLLGGSFITANVCADIFRKNQNVDLWLHVLKKYRSVVKNNLSVFREHPKLLMEKDHQIDITKFVSSSSPLRLMPPCEGDESKRELSKVKFGDLIVGTVVLPKEDFELVAWESRIPPYRQFVNIVVYCDDEKNFQHTASPCKKRQMLEK